MPAFSATNTQLERLIADTTLSQIMSTPMAIVFE